MKSLAELYDPESLCDKGSTHAYIEVYERLLAAYRFPHVRMLEIGIYNGDSLRMWERYFDEGEVRGIDICDQPCGQDLRPMINEARHIIHLLDATNRTQVEKHFRGQLFDVIIEDACHDDQLKVYANFKDKLAPDGLYVIEDVQRLDSEREAFENIDPTRWVHILDLRKSKGRYDDVLVVIGGKK